MNTDPFQKRFQRFRLKWKEHFFLRNFCLFRASLIMNLVLCAVVDSGWVLKLNKKKKKFWVKVWSRSEVKLRWRALSAFVFLFYPVKNGCSSMTSNRQWWGFFGGGGWWNFICIWFICRALSHAAVHQSISALWKKKKLCNTEHLSQLIEAKVSALLFCSRISSFEWIKMGTSFCSVITKRHLCELYK